MTNKKMFAMPLAEARKYLLLTTITSFDDSGITIKKSQIIANTSNLSNSTKELLAATPCTFEPSSSTKGSMSEEHYNNSNDDEKEDAHTAPSCHNSDLYNRINALNDKDHNSEDTKHHVVPNKERERCLTSKLHNNENPFFKKGDRKQNLIIVLLNHRDVFD